MNWLIVVCYVVCLLCRFLLSCLFAVLFVCCLVCLLSCLFAALFTCISMQRRREASYILQRGLHSRIFNLRSAVPFTHRQPFAKITGVDAVSLSHFAPLSPTFHHFYRNFTTTLLKKQHLFAKFFIIFSFFS